MKCSKCGYRAKDIAHMAAHYRKAHPKSMIKKKSTGTRADGFTAAERAKLRRMIR